MIVKFDRQEKVDRLQTLWEGDILPMVFGDAEPELQAGTAAASAGAGAAEDGLDPNSAPPEPLPPRSPLEILDELERLLEFLLGPQSIFLQLYLKPLRRGLALLANLPSPPHPLQVAAHAGNLPFLVYRLEDASRGLLRATPSQGR